ncbi:MAG: ANTAR domain-containing protein [Cycloclasticus sp.]
MDMKSKILLFNTTADDLVDIQERLSATNYDIVVVTSDLSDVSRVSLAGTVDLVMAVTDKRFDQLFSCVQQMNVHAPVPVVIFTYDDSRDVIQLAIKAGVSAYIVDGLQAKRVSSILDTARFRFNEQQSIKNELEKAKNTLNERKLIDRAKGILMQRSKITEDAAYKAMRKMAMDKNIKMANLAQSVISASELMK